MLYYMCVCIYAVLYVCMCVFVMQARTHKMQQYLEANPVAI